MHLPANRKIHRRALHWKLCALLILGLSQASHAKCYRVDKVGTSNTVQDNEIRPGEGTARAINSCDTCNGSMGLPSVINVTSADFQLPGTLLASGTASFMEYGNNVADSPDTVFFRCEIQDAASLFEMYSTNGDNYYSGHQDYQYGTTVGLTAGYATAWKDVISRITNLETGEYFTHIWKARRLTGLDRDSRGFLLVKAKNMSRIRTELFRVAVPNGIGVTTLGTYDYKQPNAYIAFSGPGISGPVAGTNHLTNYPGWPDYWPGTIGMYGRVSITRSSTCSVINVTPVVNFPSISITELNAGQVLSLPFTLQFKCEAAIVSGVSNGTMAMGFLPSPWSLTAAEVLWLYNPDGSLNYLLSDRYFDSDIASGVGIRIIRNGKIINLLSSEQTMSGNAGGWYPAVGPRSTLLGSQSGINYYSEVFTAILHKLSSEKVTAGRVEATAQVIIRVQ